MKKQTIKQLSKIIMMMMCLTLLIPIVSRANISFAEIGSLTIILTETVNGEQTKPLEGVSFAVYKVNDGTESTEIPTGATPVQTITTNASGTAYFNLIEGAHELGRYLVVQTSAPANVVTRVANFLVDIPMTSTDGTSLTYDVTVNPKNNSVYGTVTLIKVDKTTQTGLAGAKFDLYKKSGENWVSYATDLTTADGVNDKDALNNVLPVGTIKVEGLPAGTYGFIEKSTLDGYILDNKTIYVFTVELDGNGNTLVTNGNIKVENEKPTLTKEITTELKDGSASIGETITYKITSPIPTKVDELATYKMHEKIDDGLTYTAGTVVVKAIKNSDEITLSKDTDYTLTNNGQEFEIVFTDAGKIKLKGNNTVQVTYDAKLNENANIGPDVNETNTTLTYSTTVKSDHTGTNNTTSIKALTAVKPVKTGGFYIKKVDKDGNVIPTGAKFKITTDFFGNGPFIDGVELTTDENGYASYSGLEYGTYYLVETQAPTYVETVDGQEVTKYYNKLNTTIRVTVSDTTYSEANAVEVINRKGFELPATGATGTIVMIVAGLAIITLGVKVTKDKK